MGEAFISGETEQPINDAARPFPVIGRIADDAFRLDVRAVDDASAFAVSFPGTRS